jgi:iron complex outermembrane receptor protein
MALAPRRPRVLARPRSRPDRLSRLAAAAAALRALPLAPAVAALAALLLATPAARADAPAPDPAASGSAPVPPPAPLPVVPVPEITVTATRTPSEVLDVPGNVTVLDRETIERSGARDLPDLLRREAGVYVTNTTTNREGYTVEARGFNNGGGNGGRTLVLVDGRRVNEEATATVDWSFLTLDDVERVEIVRGPVSAAHGDNALAGVIQVFTRHPRDDGVRATLRTRLGTYDTSNASALVEGKDGPVSVSAFYDYDSTDAYRERANFRAGNAEVQLRLALGERGHLAVKGGYGSVDRLRPGSLTREEIALSRRQAEPGSADNMETVRQRFVQATLELAVTDHVTIRVLPYHRRRTSASVFDDPTFLFDADAESDALGLDSQIELSHELFGMRHRLLVGGDLLQEDVDNDALFVSIDPIFGNLGFPTRNSSRRKVTGVFVHDELWLTDELLLSLGVRRDEATYRATDRVTGQRFRVAHNEWAPRAALTWRFASRASAYASYSRGFRFPNLTEVFGNFGNNPGLVPETSDAYEVGLKLRSERVTLNLSLYHMTVHDEILFNPEALNPFFLPLEFPGIDTNLDRVRHRGVELFASVRPVAWLEVFGTYTYDDVQVRHDPVTGLAGSELPITPRHRGTGGVRLLLPFGFEAGVSARFVGSRVLANDLANRLEEMSGFASYDARIAWRRELTPFLEVELEAVGYNLTDREFNEFGGRSTFPPVSVGFFPSPERHYLVGARLVMRR